MRKGEWKGGGREGGREGVPLVLERPWLRSLICSGTECMAASLVKVKLMRFHLVIGGRRLAQYTGGGETKTKEEIKEEKIKITCDSAYLLIRERNTV